MSSVLHGLKEGMGRGMPKKHHIYDSIDQQTHIYRTFCRKIIIKLHENSSPIQTQTHAPALSLKLPTAEIRRTAP